MKQMIAGCLLLANQAVWADWHPANYSVEVVLAGQGGVTARRLSGKSTR